MTPRRSSRKKTIAYYGPPKTLQTSLAQRKSLETIPTAASSRGCADTMLSAEPVIDREPQEEGSTNTSVALPEAHTLNDSPTESPECGVDISAPQNRTTLEKHPSPRPKKSHVSSSSTPLQTDTTSSVTLAQSINHAGMAGGVACIANVSCQASQHVSSFIQQREMLFQQALFDCIMDTRVPGPKLRSNIAEEVKGRLEHVLAAHEKEPMHIIPSIRSRARFYHSSIHLRYRYGMSGEKLNNLLDKPVPRAGLYSHKDRNRVLYFWAVHQGNLNYGEISYELSLPLGCLLYWVMHFVNSIK